MLQSAPPVLLFFLVSMLLAWVGLSHFRSAHWHSWPRAAVLVLTAAISWTASRELMRTNDQIVHSTGTLLLELAGHFSNQVRKSSPSSVIDENGKVSLAEMDSLKGLVGRSPSLDNVQIILRKPNQQYSSVVFKRAYDGSVSVDETQAVTLRKSDPYSEVIEEAFGGASKVIPLDPMKGSLAAFVPLTSSGQFVSAILRVDSKGEINGVVRRHPTATEVLFEFLLLQATGILTVMRIGSSVKTDSDQKAKAHEEHFAEEHERLELVVNSVNGVLWERDVEKGALVIVSSQAEGFLGYGYDRWCGETGFQASILHVDDRAQVETAWKKLTEKPMHFHLEYRARKSDGGWAWIAEDGTSKIGADGRMIICGMLRDQTSQHQAATAAEETHRLMVDAARQAGMAEIANGVLHNVGNVLNSLNVLAKLHAEAVVKSRVGNLGKAARMLQEHEQDIVEFLSESPQGMSLPRYMASLSDFLVRENGRLYSESRDIVERIEHISDIISLQQQHGRAASLKDRVDVASLLDDALRLEGSNMTGLDIKIVRHYADLPPLMLPKSQVLQVFVNLISNARHAMSVPGIAQRTLTLSIGPVGPQKVRISIEDSGCGIPLENIGRLFVNGFTTRSDGNGFGLHHAGLVVQDMGGTLTAESEGRGKGAKFILELPIPESEQGFEADPKKSSGEKPLAQSMPYLRPMTMLRDSVKPTLDSSPNRSN